ncbi:bactofilin family protein [Candidatus Rariloculus sp.]|uniref:bactofilin family protein n=1 Tax=Candidatus Rariloculus sp. TaxID=3101265 RepID=UPI003D0BD7F7
MLGRNRRPRSTITTLVGADTRVRGDVEFTGGFHVDGYIKGNIKAVGDERSVLSISERGCVEGVVIAPHVLLNGTVKGDVHASERLELGTKARIIGNIQYKLIGLEIGAEVNGKLIHADTDRAGRPRPGQNEPGPSEARPAQTERQGAARQIEPVRTINVVGE